MTKEEKILLVKDLGQRILYGVKFKLTVTFYTITGIDLTTVEDGEWQGWDYVVRAKGIAPVEIEYVKPYLRPMSSMTEEEKKEYHSICDEEEREEKEFGEWVIRVYYHNTIESIDWLNAHHFDFRNLIGKGLALEAPEGMYA